MAPPSYRGLLVSLKEGFIVLGMLLGYTAGLAFNERTQGWRCVYAIAVPIAACMIAGVFLLPPSARWLCLRGRLEDARASLGFVLPPKPAARAFDEISKAAGAAKSARGGKDEAFDIATVRARLSEPACAQALFIGIGLVVLQQFTGQPSVLYYVSSLFEQVGLGDSAAVGLAGFKLVCTLVAVFTVDKRGRKALLLVGCALMAVALAFLTIAFTLPNDFANRNSAAVLGAMFLCESEARSARALDQDAARSDRAALSLPPPPSPVRQPQISAGTRSASGRSCGRSSRRSSRSTCAARRSRSPS